MVNDVSIISPCILNLVKTDDIYYLFDFRIKTICGHKKIKLDASLSLKLSQKMSAAANEERKREREIHIKMDLIFIL